MKYVVRGFLVVFMIFFMSSNVSAITIETDNSKRGTIDTDSYYVTNRGTVTVQNVAPNDTAFEAYKILDAYYNSINNKITYEFTSSFKNYAEERGWNGTVEDYVDMGNSLDIGFSDLIVGFTQYVTTNSIKEKTALTANDGAISGTLTAGSYLIIPKAASTANIYSPMIGNLEFNYENNEWILNNAKVIAKVSHTYMDIECPTNSGFDMGKRYSLVGDTFGIQARVSVPNNENIEAYGTDSKAINARVVIPGTIDYLGNVKVLYTDNNVVSNYEYTVVQHTNNSNLYDVMDNDHVIGNVEIQSSGGGSKEIVLTIDSLSNIHTPYILIKFDVKLNENATVGSTGNIIDGRFSIYNPFVNTSVTGSAAPFKVVTHGISVKTTDNGGNVLSGAKYKVYSDANLETEAGEAIYNADSQRSRMLVKLGYNGSFSVESKTFYVKEVVAPGGYALSDEVYTVTVSPDDNSYSEIIVKNVKPGTLPITGGKGGFLYFILGLIVVGWAIVYYKFEKALKENETV